MLVLILMVLAAFLAAASAEAVGTSASPTPGKLVLRVDWLDNVNSTNPFAAVGICEYQIDHLNYDLLVGFNATDMSPRPELATSWSSSSDQKTWTFKIRQGVKWSDGVPLTAKDVAFTFNYIIKNNIAGYLMFTTGIKDVVAPDDTTVVFNCNYPKADILRMWVPILPEHIWGKIKPADVTQYANNPPVVGSGPFQSVKLVRGQYIVLKANKDYWGGAPKVDEIIFITASNTNTMVDDLKSGAVDVVIDMRVVQGKALDPKKFTFQTGLSKGFYELGFNCSTSAYSKGNPVLKDWKFRQALNYAVDKQKILDVAFLGQGSVASGVIQPGYFPKSCDYHWQPSADQTYPFDLNKASEALTAAGYPLKNGVRVDKQGKPITLRLEALQKMHENQTAAKFIAGWFGQLGLNIQYSVVDDGTLIGQQYNFVGNNFTPDYDMFMWNWTGLGVDPNFILSVFTTAQVANWSDCMYSNPEYDKLFTEQARTVDQQQRKAIIWKMQELLYQQTPYVTMVYAADSTAFSNKWQGWVASPTGACVAYNADNIDSWVNVHLATAGSTTSKSGTNAWLIIGIVCAVVVVLGTATFVITRRRRDRRVEE